MVKFKKLWLFERSEFQRFLNFIIAQSIAEIIYVTVYTSLHQRPNTYSMQPLMRLVYGSKSCAISAQLISSPFLICNGSTHRKHKNYLWLYNLPPRFLFFYSALSKRYKPKEENSTFATQTAINGGSICPYPRETQKL